MGDDWAVFLVAACGCSQPSGGVHADGAAQAWLLAACRGSHQLHDTTQAETVSRRLLCLRIYCSVVFGYGALYEDIITRVWNWVERERYHLSAHVSAGYIARSECVRSTVSDLANRLCCQPVLLCVCPQWFYSRYSYYSLLQCALLQTNSWPPTPRSVSQLQAHWQVQCFRFEILGARVWRRLGRTSL